jgi:peptidoglycan/LPS O-acetylase OafA/YrhL
MTRPAEIKALSGARALPPLMIVLYHTCTFHQYVPAEAVLGPPILKGYLWVEFFFALSGFILIHVYGTRAREFWRGRAYVPFLQARLARLYPVHLVTLLSILLLMWTLNALDHEAYVSIYRGPHAPLNTWSTFIANLFLVQAWNILPDLTWNSVAWFVSVEFLLCLLFPIYLMLARGGWWSAIGLIVAGTAGLAFLSFTGKHGLDITFHNGIFRGMSAFAIGVGMCVLYGKTKTFGDSLPEWAISLAQAAVLIWLGLGIFDNGWSHTTQDIYTVVPMFWLVYVLAFDRGFAARFMQTRTMTKLGEWSYAIYMGQTAWLQLIRFFERGYPSNDTLVFGIRFGDLIWWPEPFALLAVCIGWGALLCTFIEIPANRAVRRFFARRAATA